MPLYDQKGKFNPTKKTQGLYGSGGQLQVNSSQTSNPKSFKQKVEGINSAIRNTQTNLLVGAGKGVANTAYGIQNIGGKILNKTVNPIADKLATAISGKKPTTAPSSFVMQKPGVLNPKGIAQNIGYGAEQIGEFFVPGGAISRAGKAVEGASGLAKLSEAGKLGKFASGAIKVGAKAGLEAAGSAAVTAAQGGDTHDIESNAGLAAAFPIVGGAVKGIAKGKVLGFASKIDQPAVQAATSLGINLPASAANKSKIVGLIESTADKSLIGGGKVTQKIEAAHATLNKVADKIVSSFGTTSNSSLAGESAVKGFNDFKTSYKKTTNALYDVFQKEAKNIPAQLDNTKQAINDIVTSSGGVIGGSSLPKKFENIAEDLAQGKPLTFDNIRKTRSEIGQMLKNYNDPLVTGNKASFKKLYAALTQDMRTTIQATGRTDILEAMTKADEAYKTGIQKINSTFGKKINKLANQPDKIVNALFSPSVSANDIPQIFETVGPQAKKSLQGAILENIFSKSRNAEGNFLPQGLSRQIDRYGEEKLASIFGDEALSKIKEIGTVAQSLGRGAKIAEGSQTAYLLRAAAELGLFFSNPVTALKVLVGDAALTRLVNSARGQKFLTSGIKLTGKTGDIISKGAKIAPAIRSATTSSSRQ